MTLIKSSTLIIHQSLSWPQQLGSVQWPDVWIWKGCSSNRLHPDRGRAAPPGTQQSNKDRRTIHYNRFLGNLKSHFKFSAKNINYNSQQNQQSLKYPFWPRSPTRLCCWWQTWPTDVQLCGGKRTVFFCDRRRWGISPVLHETTEPHPPVGGTENDAYIYFTH